MQGKEKIAECCILCYIKHKARHAYKDSMVMGNKMFLCEQFILI